MSAPLKRTGDTIHNAAKNSRQDSDTEPETIDHAIASDEEIIHMIPTTINDVFLANKAPDPQVAQKALGDWAEPIILVVSKQTRDRFLTALSEINKQHDTNTTSYTKDTNTAPKTMFDVHTNNENTCNFDRSSLLMRTYKHHINSLNEIQKTFSESQLKEDCTGSSELDEFREVRKQLTDFYVLGAKVNNMTEKVKAGQSDYMIKTKLDFIPNKLPNTFIQKVRKDIELTTANANACMYNETLSTFSDIMMHTEGHVQNTNRKILAKAWRSVKRSNKDNANTEFRHKKFNQTDPEIRTQPHQERRQQHYHHREEPTYENKRSHYQQRQKHYDHRPYKPNYYRDETTRSHRPRTYYSKPYRHRQDTVSTDQEPHFRRNSSYYEDYPTIQESHGRTYSSRHYPSRLNY